MKAFTLFKNALPVALLAATPNAMARSGLTHCASVDSRFALEFSEITFRPGKPYAFFDYAKINGATYFGGQGSMMGQGTVTASTIDMTLVWTETGSKEKNKMGLLKGTLVGGQWVLELTPWNSRTDAYDTKNVIELTNCETSEP